MDGLREAGSLLAEVWREWQSDRALSLGAALAYYTLFSLAPMLLLVIAVVAVVLGRSAAEGEVVAQMQALLGPQGAEIVQELILNASNTSVAATAVGLITMIIGATSVLGQLESSLNQIWNVAPRPGRRYASIVTTRAKHLSLILGMGLLLLLSLAISTALAAVDETLALRAPKLAVLLLTVHIAVSLFLSATMFAAVFKALPDTRIPWRDVWLGGLVTAILFAVGRGLIAAYLGRAAPQSVYGAAGSVFALLLWIYYSAQIILIGAEFTEVYSRRAGSRRSGETAPLTRGEAGPIRDVEKDE